MDCVCRTCEKHGEDPYCHGKCQEYIEYQKKLEEYREKKFKNKTAYIALSDVKKQGMKRMFKT